MRLYLSSFRTGAHPARLLALAGGPRTAVLTHALDDAPPEVRDAAVGREVGELAALGLDPYPVDLREPGAVGALAGYDLLWVRGGNVFTLRRALADTGADTVLVDLLRRDTVAYGGYSAGCCVLADDLSGLERVDDPGDPPVRTGLGLLDRAFVPHVRTPEHPESADCDALAAAYAAAGRPHWALRDGDVLVVDGPVTELLTG